MVVQHDRTLLRAVNVDEIAAHLRESDEAVGYVLLPTSKHADYVNQKRTWLGERGIRGSAADIATLARSFGDVGSSTSTRRLLPCLTWHDSTHIASVAFYRELFAREMGILGFIESTLGPRQASDALELSLPQFVRKWRTWLLDDGVTAPAVGHLDGSAVRPSLSDLERAHGQAAGRRWQPDRADDGACARLQDTQYSRSS